MSIFCLMWNLVDSSVVQGQELDLRGAPPFALCQEMLTGRLKVKISSRTSLDFAALLQNVDDSDAIESAYTKIDRVRNNLHPKDEMIIDIDSIDPTPQGSFIIDLRKKIVWVNSSHVYGSKWVAANIDSGAACCVVKVTQGRYSHYYQDTDGSWNFGGSTRAGGVWTATTYGSNLYRGFKGVAKDAGTNKADIVMYYYY